MHMPMPMLPTAPMPRVIMRLSGSRRPLLLDGAVGADGTLHASMPSPSASADKRPSEAEAAWKSASSSDAGTSNPLLAEPQVLLLIPRSPPAPTSSRERKVGLGVADGAAAATAANAEAGVVAEDGEAGENNRGVAEEDSTATAAEDDEEDEAEEEEGAEEEMDGGDGAADTPCRALEAMMAAICASLLQLSARAR